MTFSTAPMCRISLNCLTPYPSSARIAKAMEVDRLGGDSGQDCRLTRLAAQPTGSLITISLLTVRRTHEDLRSRLA